LLALATCVTLAMTRGTAASEPRAPVPQPPESGDLYLGHPASQGEDARPGYALWFADGGGWHLEVTGSGRHHFKGRVRIVGTGSLGEVFEWMGPGRAPGTGLYRFVKVVTDQREAFFDFVAEPGSGSGVLMTARGEIEWDLAVGGPEGPCDHDPTRVRIGRGGRNPRQIPFNTPYRP
jgi:hypothetical protein